jgi:hypothetical protein
MKHKTALLFICLMTLSVFSACSGGGSAGTGTITIEGRLRTNLDQPLVGATVAIVGESVTAVSDQSGAFSLSADGFQDQVTDITLSIISQNETSTAILPNVSTDVATISVTITVDRGSNVVVVENVEVRAKIVGLCDFYFENFRTIRQANATRPAIECTAKVWLKQDGRPLTDGPFVLQ